MNSSFEKGMVSQMSINQRRNPGKRRKRQEVIELFESDMYSSVDEIAEMAGIAKKSVRNYLGKRRLATIKDNGSEDSEQEEEKSKNGVLTSEKVDKIVSERNARIRQLYDDGVSITEVARREHLTMDQAKEIYYSLGLSIYTEQELEQIEEMREAKRKAERKEAQRRRKRELERKRRARIRAEKEREKEEEKIPEQSFRGIVKKMQEYVRQRNSKAAIEYAESVINDADFLTKKEKDELFIIVQYIKSKRRAHEIDKSKYSKTHDGEDR